MSHSMPADSRARQLIGSDFNIEDIMFNYMRSYMWYMICERLGLGIEV